jgi:hypothetical protein
MAYKKQLKINIYIVAKENILMSDIEGGREGGHVAFSISTIIKFRRTNIC